jgi:imidazoleglycerol phosphate synthase glutamine amidotransferase subunit HisH
MENCVENFKFSQQENKEILILTIGWQANKALEKDSEVAKSFENFEFVHSYFTSRFHWRIML